jgi:cytochrome c2
MKQKSLLILSFIFTAVVTFTACNADEKAPGAATPGASATPKDQAEVHGTEIKAGEVEVKTPLNQEWVTNGKATYELKCQGCHKLTDERVVGPGWKGVTQRREPHWIMNMITNADMMLEKDPEAQKLLEQCLVRMPNQNLSKDESRQVLEFMRSNDGVK